jgi:hypothetical protein
MRRLLPMRTSTCAVVSVAGLVQRVADRLEEVAGSFAGMTKSEPSISRIISIDMSVP